jgi:lipoyl(octanoyl) transferase
MHGIALNCTNDLGAYERIIPCGIDDADVTSLSLETGRDITVEEVRPLLADALQRHLQPLITATTANLHTPAPATAVG